jgi:hypothetical protein
LIVNRRSFLASCGAAALSAASGRALAQTAAMVAPAAPATAPSGYWRAFPDLQPALFPAEDLARLAKGDGNITGLSSEPEWLKDAKGEILRGPNGRFILSATPEDEIDDEENFALPAGYTYLGQFIDHDLTFRNDERFQQTGGMAPNERSAELDLDSLYAGGPSRIPYLYERDGIRLVRGRSLTQNGRECASLDHARVEGRAIIGDKRNDENVIVSQLHGVFADFHNAVADSMKSADFNTVRRTVVRHYQWMILTDFLPRLCGPGVVEALVPELGQTKPGAALRTNLTFARNLPAGRLPLEFSDAAYRFGHSLIRPVYRLNLPMRGTAEERKQNPAIAGRKVIFAAAENSGLNGFREFPREWGIDWALYFETSKPMSTTLIADGPKRVQAAYKIDTALANPLAYLPEFAATDPSGRIRRDNAGFPAAQPGTIQNLALRNLMRSQTSLLPSGQDVARAVGLNPLADNEIRIGKANVAGLANNPSIAEFGDSFRGKAPLWVYILAEAAHGWTQRAARLNGDLERNTAPTFLGPVGGRLVAETFVALLAADPQSVLNAPDWRPSLGRAGKFTMVDLVRFAGHG